MMIDQKRVQQLINELEEVEALISHGVRTGQDKGQWMENLERERAQLECAIDDEGTIYEYS